MSLASSHLAAFCGIALIASLAAIPAAPAKAQPGKGSLFVYIGGYTKGKTAGIFIYSLNLASGKLTPVGTGPDVESPSYLALHPNHKYLYAVNETDTFEGKPGGGVSSYKIDSKTGALTLLNAQTSGGGGPCHISVDASGTHVFVANYGGGSAEVLSINKDGSLGAPSCFVQHTGTGPDATRQEGPHAHSAIPDPTGKYVLVNDLGTDKVVVYKYDSTNGTISADGVDPGVVAGGSGPRHFVFHPDGRHGYCINEMKSTITAFNYDPANGSLKEYQSISTLPAGFTGATTCAEIEMSPDGKFVYGSNRGADNLAIFAVQKDATLKLVGHTSTGGKTPRGFQIDPTGSWLICGNQNSNSVLVFKRNKSNGALTPVGDPLTVEAPVTVVFLKPGS